MKASEFILTEKRKRKKRLRGAAYGPGPYGGYGYLSGYSGDGGDSVGEASYPGNIGMMEISKFVKVASEEEKKTLKDLISKKKFKVAWNLIQRVTGVKLQGQQFQEDITADVMLDNGERKKVRYAPGRKNIIDMIVRYYLKQGLKVLKVNDEEIEWEENTVKENFADGTLNEYRNALYDFVKSKFPTWPEYVLKDFLYAQAKGIRDKEELKDFLDRNQKDYGQVKWRLEKLAITVDIFTPKTQRMIQQREGGSSNPLKVPRDAERHELQAKIIQQKGVSPEPIIVAKLSNGYDLIEGWHRTIQHLKAYPEGYTGPAWVAYGATYTSEDVAENFADGKVKGKSRPGRVKRAGASCKGSVTDLRARARKYGGERGKMYHWCANMKSGKK